MVVKSVVKTVEKTAPRSVEMWVTLRAGQKGDLMVAQSEMSMAGTKVVHLVALMVQQMADL